MYGLDYSLVFVRLSRSWPAVMLRLVSMFEVKQLARGYVWWPSIDHDIEKLAKTCEACMSVNNAPPVSPLSPWLWPRKPWQRLHIDFAGPLFGKMYFILIDAHSKWPEIWEMSSTSRGFKAHLFCFWTSRTGSVR